MLQGGKMKGKVALGMALATLAIGAVPANASTARDLRLMKHRVAVLTTRLNQTSTALNTLLATMNTCTQLSAVSQYGDGSSNGYLYQGLFASAPFMTSALDYTVNTSTDSFVYMMTWSSLCLGNAALQRHSISPTLTPTPGRAAR
jgi:hypothetical protein